MNLKIAPLPDEENDFLMHLHDLRLPGTGSLLSCHIPKGLTLLHSESSVKRKAIMDALKNGHPHSWVMGKPMNAYSQEEKILLKLSLVDHDAPLVEHFTVLENILLPFRALGIEEKTLVKDVKQGLEWLKLAKIASKKTQFLSVSERFAVIFCRAVLAKNAFLVVHSDAGMLDEFLSYARPLSTLGVSIVVLCETLPQDKDRYRVVSL